MNPFNARPMLFRALTLTVLEATPTLHDPTNGNNPEGSPEEDNNAGSMWSSETGMRGGSGLTQAKASSKSLSNFPMIRTRSK